MTGHNPLAPTPPSTIPRTQPNTPQREEHLQPFIRRYSVLDRRNQQSPSSTSTFPRNFEISEENIIQRRLRGPTRRPKLYISEGMRRRMKRIAKKNKADRTFLDTNTEDTTDSYDMATSEETDHNDQAPDNNDENDVQEEEQGTQENVPERSPVEFLMSLPPEELKEADENEEPYDAGEDTEEETERESDTGDIPPISKLYDEDDNDTEEAPTEIDDASDDVPDDDNYKLVIAALQAVRQNLDVLEQAIKKFKPTNYDV